MVEQVRVRKEQDTGKRGGKISYQFTQIFKKKLGLAFLINISKSALSLLYL